MKAILKIEEMPKSCFECPFRQKYSPDEILCWATGKIFEETFGGTIENRHSSCPLKEMIEEDK